MPLFRLVPILLLALGLGACGMVGRSSREDAVAPAAESPTARPVSVAWTAARARKCGFSFDGQKLRADFLAREARDGKAPETVAQSAQAYDIALARFTKSLSSTAGYCDKRRVEYIRLDLNRHLAGDFTPAPKRAGDKIEED